MKIRTVLCPLDFSPLSYLALELATDLSRAFAARLVVHHNLRAEGPGAAIDWMQQEAEPGTSEVTAENRLRAIFQRVPAALQPLAVLTHGEAASSILLVGRQVGADLLVLGRNGADAIGEDEIGTATGIVLRRAKLPILVVPRPEALPRRMSPRSGRHVNAFAGVVGVDDLVASVPAAHPYRGPVWPVDSSPRLEPLRELAADSSR